MTTEIALDVKNLWFRYPIGDWILRGVNLTLHSGEQVLIIGDTGSGKTTLLRALTKVGQAVYGGEQRGEVIIEGKSLESLQLEEIFKYVHVIGQNPYLYFTEPLVQQDLLSYAQRVHGDQEVAARAVSRAVESTGVHKLLSKYCFELSGGEARRALVAKSLVADPIVFAFDEPLMWLDDQGVGDFIELLRLLKGLGKTALVFEHRFLPIYKHFNRVMLLKGGELRDVTSLLLNRAQADGVTSRNALVKRNTSPNSSLALRVRELHYSYEDAPVLREVSLDIEKGDLVLIYGLNGSGKTTLLKVLSGYLKPKRGRVERYVDAIYIPQNAILFYTEETVEKEVQELCKARKLGKDCIEEGTLRAKQIGLSLGQSVFNLSHGQMVKLAVELAILTRAGLLLLDEPFSGLTYRDRLLLLNRLASLGIAVVVASSSLDAVVSSMWTKMYKLEGGTLRNLELQHRYDLINASELYSEVVAIA